MVPPYNPNEPFNQPIPNNADYGMPPKKKRRWWLWILISFLALMMLCGLGIGGCTYWAISKTKPAFDATNKFYKAATKGEDLEPYICKDKDAEEMAQDFEDANDERGELTSYNFNGYANEDGTVTISGKVRRDGESQYVEVEVRKENGKYKVCDINNNAVDDDDINN